MSELFEVDKSGMPPTSVASHRKLVKNAGEKEVKYI